MAELLEQNRFLSRCKEKEDFNQYWYSASTIRAIVDECQQHGKRVACISTPSVFFSMNDELRCSGALLEFDPKFSRKAGPAFLKYDFNDPANIPEKLQNVFDFVVIDPPFITREVWEKYATTAKLLLTKGHGDIPEGKILLTTIDENASLIEQLLGCKPQKFRPSIPKLVYQYSIYTSYASKNLSELNPEIPSD